MERQRSRGPCAICDGIVIDSDGDLDAAGNQAYTRWEGCYIGGAFYHFHCADAERKGDLGRVKT